MMSPPTTAPRTESRPPRITTGNTFRPTSARCTSTPSMLPQITPPSAETVPAIAHAALEEEPCEDAEESQGDDNAQNLDRRHGGGADRKRRVADAERQRARL